jgi:hypothetical protein
MVYLRIALAEAKMESSQLLPALLHEFEQAHGARPVQQEILVHHKKGLDFELRFDPAHHLKQFIARLVKVDNFPLPPKKEEVVQKLHPIGQPTDGIMVAAVPPLRFGRRIP